jgi:hypothetical protein
MLSKIKRIDDYRECDPRLKNVSANRLFLNFMYCKLRYGADLNDYLNYELFSRSHLARKSFVLRRFENKVFKAFNPIEAREICKDKAKFNERFHAFVHRKFLDAASASYEDFCEFTEGIDSFIAKPLFGLRGDGVEIIKDVKQLSEEAKKELFDKHSSLQSILEEVVVQHPDLQELHPGSLNTMRIATMRSEGKIEIIGAALRIGTGDNIVDNFHKGGVVAGIDVESGIVKTSGISALHRRFVVHPDTKKQIVGFQIPHWDKVKETMVQVGEMIPEMNYIGWDVAVDSKDNVVLIEGNCMPDFDVLQITTQEGLYDKVKSIMDKNGYSI